ncbi:MAG: tRNA (N6-threonylcarbamoyladenosine(37)-N6)-methyltransferase TrmO [Archaeoglobales archaeon]|nr:MAG: tRNA (N6-threonylcarbamoyladenosine(37)-N6)-methyltransferase TrmO [Archaeoglobales archaeon]
MLKPIGYVVDENTIEILEEYEDGIEGLEEGMSIWILYNLHKAKELLKVHPHGDVRVVRGVFATRSPNRPNRIGMILATIKKIEGRRIHLDYLDAFVGTPVIDIKPYVEIYDCVGFVLSGDQIRKRIEYDRLIEGYIDLDVQIQPNGFDCTLMKVSRLKGFGKIEFQSKELPEVEEVPFDGDWVFLSRGFYRAYLNERINMPNDLIAIARPRSTLVRCGVDVLTAVWDAGYVGRSEVGLVVHNDVWLRRNARIVQLIFLKLSERTKPYSGSYQFENI